MRPSSTSKRGRFWRVCDWKALRPEIQLSRPFFARANGSTLRISQQPSGSKDQRRPLRSEEHTSELQSLMRISYAVFCLKKKNKQPPQKTAAPTQTVTQSTRTRTTHKPRV